MKQTLQIPLILVSIILAMACNAQTTPAGYRLTKTEKDICDSLQVDTTIIQDIRKYNTQKIEPFHYSLSKIYENGKWSELDPIYLDGLVLHEKHSKSYDLVFKLKDSFRKRGYIIFLLENNFNIDNQADYIGILKTTDKYVVLKQINTDGINYGIDTDSLLTIVRRLDDKYALELIGVSGDWCEFIIHNQPKKWMDFAKEVYEVCPDVVEQGTGTIKDLAEVMHETKRLYFWWD